MVARKIVQLAAATIGDSPGQTYAMVVALAHDGSAWWITNPAAVAAVRAQLPALPAREAGGSSEGRPATAASGPADGARVDVCSACLKASCQQGTTICEDATAGMALSLTVGELRRLALEDAKYWSAGKATP